MRTKSKTSLIFSKFKALVENQFNTKIKCLRSNGGGEFYNHLFKSHLSTPDIQHQISCPYTPAQNVVAERKHCHLLNIVHTLFLDFGVPSTLWVDALATAIYLINCTPSPKYSQQISI